MATLYELEDSFKLIQSLIEEGADEEIFVEALANIKVDLAGKLEGYAMVIKNIESDVEGYKAEEKRLSTRRKSMENKVKRMKSSMHDAMITANERKVQGERFSFNVQNGRRVLQVNDESHIPEGYYEPQPPVLNRKELLEDLMRGDEIEGCEIMQGEHLVIR